MAKQVVVADEASNVGRKAYCRSLVVTCWEVMLETDLFLELEMAMEIPLGLETVLDIVVVVAEASIHSLLRADSGSHLCHVHDPLALGPDHLFPGPGIDLYSG